MEGTSQDNARDRRKSSTGGTAGNHRAILMEATFVYNRGTDV